MTSAEYQNIEWDHPDPVPSKFPIEGNIEGIKVYTNVQVPEEELKIYVNRGRSLWKTLSAIYVFVNGDEVELQYVEDNRAFERIRRITGYLVGTLDRFNDGKRAEESERVKHRI